MIVLHGGGPTARPVRHDDRQVLLKMRADEALRASRVMGRASNPPIPDFLAQGWAVYMVDYRPNPRFTLDPLELEDTVVAVNKARSFAFVDPKRIAMFGGSHGAHVTGRMTSRVDLACAVLCAPAGLDLIALSHQAEKGVRIGGNQRLIREMEQRSGVKMAEIEKNPEAYQYSSLLTEVTKVRCPILMISGRNDVSAPLAVMDIYVDKLRAAGKEAETYHPDNGPHGFYVGLPRPIPETAESTRRAVAFIKTHFERRATASHGIGNLDAKQQNGMVLIPARRVIVGTSQAERQELAKRYEFHPSWLNDDLPRNDVALPAFWIDRYPVTNAQYLAFVQATGRPLPMWWRRLGGAFPGDYADHPAVGVGAKDAVAYAEWVGKRLPRAEEWEAAVSGESRSLFAWGDAWPGPLKHVGVGTMKILPDRPGTRPVGSGQFGRSASGVEDFAGQVLEWGADVLPRRGSRARILKGASWFQEDPVNFRVASGYYASENWQSNLTGLRCVLDGDRTPPQVPKAQAMPVPSASSKRQKPAPETSFGPPVLVAGRSGARHLSIRVPKFGIEGIDMMVPETIRWNRATVLNWNQKPKLTWTERSPQRAAYEMQLPDLHLSAEFLAHDDFVEQRFTVTNLTDKAGDFRTSTCFKLQSLPMFYDCEQLRTFALGADGRLVSVRGLARLGNEAVRWITRFRGEELGEDPRWALLAVVSRDGRRIISASQSGTGTEFSVGTNALFTCLHADSTAQVEAGQKATTREIFWFIEGSREELVWRFRQESLSEPK